MKNSLIIFAMVNLAAVTISFTETRSIIGLVTDPQGKPLSGVIVKVKDATAHTVTDFKGKYTILIEPQNQILVFSMAGFNAVEEKINGRSVINVRLDYADYDSVSTVAEVKCEVIGIADPQPVQFDSI
jgi:CarboxypepD_reg-like domain